MADLFEREVRPAPAPKWAAPRLHSDTEIYRAIAELAKFIARAVSNLRRDLKPIYGVMLARNRTA
jgi:hypothetical protein